MDKTYAINLFGSRAKLARELGITRSAVGQWPEVIPEPRASHIRETARRLGLLRDDMTPARHEPAEA